VSPVTGVITAVHVEAGQPVEYGQVLFDLTESKSS
jgi:biotin carboxyl carrier protein